MTKVKARVETARPALAEGARGDPDGRGMGVHRIFLFFL